MKKLEKVLKRERKEKLRLLRWRKKIRNFEKTEEKKEK